VAPRAGWHATFAVAAAVLGALALVVRRLPRVPHRP
jgi:hypothetical protein